MTKKEMIKRTREALEEFNRLPAEEQFRQMIAWGTINEKGEVLMGRGIEEDEESSEQNSESNGRE